MRGRYAAKAQRKQDQTHADLVANLQSECRTAKDRIRVLENALSEHAALKLLVENLRFQVAESTSDALKEARERCSQLMAANAALRDQASKATEFNARLLSTISRILDIDWMLPSGRVELAQILALDPDTVWPPESDFQARLSADHVLRIEEAKNRRLKNRCNMFLGRGKAALR